MVILLGWGSRAELEASATGSAREEREAGDGWFQRPTCWLAVKCNHLQAVKAALGLANPKPCSFQEGLGGEQHIFISPPVHGWVLVFGSDLPDPADDVDACFRFVVALSRRLGQVQFFSSSTVLQHHAWIRAERGRILRAYAWAGRTLWKQGCRTAAEEELEMKCLDYGEETEACFLDNRETIAANAEKVPLLAAHWSLDPARIHLHSYRPGIAGQALRRF